MRTIDKLDYGRVGGGLRAYGPGKFDTMLDAYLYDLSLNGCDDESGDSSEGEWHGLLRGFTVDGAFADVSPAADLTPDELAVLRSHAGAILTEDSQGFVTVDYYSTLDELNEAWEAIAQADAQPKKDQPTMTTNDLRRTLWQARDAVLAFLTAPMPKDPLACEDCGEYRGQSPSPILCSRCWSTPYRLRDRA